MDEETTQRFARLTEQAKFSVLEAIRRMLEQQEATKDA